MFPGNCHLIHIECLFNSLMSFWFKSCGEKHNVFFGAYMCAYNCNLICKKPICWDKEAQTPVLCIAGQDEDLWLKTQSFRSEKGRVSFEGLKLILRRFFWIEQSLTSLYFWRLWHQSLNVPNWMFCCTHVHFLVLSSVWNFKCNYIYKLRN